jgi:hypothetical protein
VVYARKLNLQRSTIGEYTKDNSVGNVLCLLNMYLQNRTIIDKRK